MGKRIFVLILVLTFVRPARAYACDGWICLGEILGYTQAGTQAVELGDRDAVRRETEARILAEHNVEVARIKADGDARLAEARVNNTRELARGMVDAQEVIGKYSLLSASVNAIKDVKLKELDVLMQTQLAAIDGKVTVDTAALAHDEALAAPGLWAELALIAVVILAVLSAIGRNAKARQAPPTALAATYRYESEDTVIVVPARKMEIYR